MSAAVPWIISTGVAIAGVVALGVLLIVSRHQLGNTRRALEHSRRGNPRRRRRPGLGPFAIRTAFQTADSLINRGIGATVRNSVEDLAGWARIERPDLARMTANGDVVIVFSDIEGSTARNEELGDRGWVKLLERHNKLVGKQVDDHGGHVVKTQGDGFMIAFSDPAQAVRSGVCVQQALHDDPDRWDHIRVRIGVHMGSSVRRGDDLFGRNVAMAARVSSEATGGEILVSESVRDAIGHAHDIVLGSPRTVELKGLHGSHDLYPVQLRSRPAVTVAIEH